MTTATKVVRNGESPKPKGLQDEERQRIKIERNDYGRDTVQRYRVEVPWLPRPHAGPGLGHGRLDENLDVYVIDYGPEDEAVAQIITIVPVSIGPSHTWTPSVDDTNYLNETCVLGDAVDRDRLVNCSIELALTEYRGRYIHEASSRDEAVG